jgi:hypothetical protein
LRRKSPLDCPLSAAGQYSILNKTIYRLTSYEHHLTTCCLTSLDLWISCKTIAIWMTHHVEHLSLLVLEVDYSSLNFFKRLLPNQKSQLRKLEIAVSQKIQMLNQFTASTVKTPEPDPRSNDGYDVQQIYEELIRRRCLPSVPIVLCSNENILKTELHLLGCYSRYYQHRYSSLEQHVSKDSLNLQPLSIPFQELLFAVGFFRYLTLTLTKDLTGYRSIQNLKPDEVNMFLQQLVHKEDSSLGSNLYCPSLVSPSSSQSTTAGSVSVFFTAASPPSAGCGTDDLSIS